MKTGTNIFSLIFIFSLISSLTIAYGNEKPDTLLPLYFVKQERITGVVFQGNQEREQLLTKSTKTGEEIFTSAAKFQLGRRYWNLLDYKQERFAFIFKTGPFTGTGDWIDSSKVAYLNADRKMFGLRNNVMINYSNRLYYDFRNYTLVEIDAWGRYDVFRQNTSGTVRDSNFNYTDYSDIDYKDRLRYGFTAKAAWGWGRQNPMNHLMISEYLLNKYYPRRVFSDDELVKLAEQIGMIKHRRDPKLPHSAEKEMEQLNEFLKSKLMLKKPGDYKAEWQMGEFRPRFDGKRVELGPYFNYYNREPDFVYGAYIDFDYANYMNYNWNSNIAVNLSYNRYKYGKWVNDWLLLEAVLGWSYYPNLKTQVNFGLKYIPGMVVNEFTDLEPVRHNFVPYFEYYTQANSKMRVDLAFAWVIADGEKFIQSGPEFSISIYRSRY